MIEVNCAQVINHNDLRKNDEYGKNIDRENIVVRCEVQIEAVRLFIHNAGVVLPVNKCKVLRLIPKTIITFGIEPDDGLKIADVYLSDLGDKMDIKLKINSVFCIDRM